MKTSQIITCALCCPIASFISLLIAFLLLDFIFPIPLAIDRIWWVRTVIYYIFTSVGNYVVLRWVLE